MRVLHLTRDFPPPGRGGISTAVADLVEAGVPHGIEAAVLSLERGRGKDLPPLWRDAVGPVPIVRLHDPKRMHEAAAALPPTAIDVVHVHEPLWWPVAEVVAGTAPLVATVHVDHAHMAALRGIEPTGASLQAQRCVLDRADVIVAPSPAAATLLRASQAGIAPRLVVVPHGIELPPAAPAMVPAAPREPLVACVGRFDEAKGTADFAAAIEPVLGARRGARAVIAGGLPASPKAERRWRRRWQEMWPPAVAARIDVAGWMDADAVGALYRRAAVVVIPSRFETFGLVALEAMVHGAAVVATRAGGLADLVDDGETGLLCEPGDREGIAAAIGRVLDDPLLAGRLGAAATAKARRDHDRAVLAPEWVRLYRRAAEVRRQAP